MFMGAFLLQLFLFFRGDLGSSSPRRTIGSLSLPSSLPSSLPCIVPRKAAIYRKAKAEPAAVAPPAAVKEKETVQVPPPVPVDLNKWDGPQVMAKEDAHFLPTGGELPLTTLRQYGRGFVCFDNVYVFNGTLRLALPPLGPPSALPLRNPQDVPFDDWTIREYLKMDGIDVGLAEMNAIEEAALRSAPLPTITSAQTFIEWPGQRFLAHFGHFVEAIAGAITLEALDSAPTPEVVLCCGCHYEPGLPYNRYESFLGSSRLNALAVAALWRGAPLLLCADVASPPPASNDAPSAWRGWPASPLDPPVKTPGLPWALHVARTCVTDRRSAHRAQTTQMANNFNAQLVSLATDEVQEVMDSVIADLRTSPLVTDAFANVTVLDEFGVDVGAALAVPRSVGPLVTVVKRTNRRSFNETSFLGLHERACVHSPRRCVAVKLESLSGPQQLLLLAETDILIGAQGNGLSHLLWERRGSALFEFFPHWGEDGEYEGKKQGLGWTNDWPFLTRLKGMTYRAADNLLGPANPVNHSPQDLSHQLNKGNLFLNFSAALENELNGLFTAWEATRDDLKAGKHVSMRQRWHYNYKGEWV